jgi:MFS family permease
MIILSVRKKIVATLFVAQSLFSAATIVAFTLTPIIAADLSGSTATAGWPNTLTLLGRAVFAYPAGWLLDRLGRRLGLSLGYLVGVIASVIAAWSVINGSFAGFMIGAIFLGGARASSEQGRYAAAEVYPAERQSKAIGWVVFAGTIGAIAGPLLVGISVDRAEARGIVPFAGPFIAAALLLMLAGLVVFILLRPDPSVLGRQVAAAEAKDRQASSGDEASSMDEGEARPLRKIFNNTFALLALASMAIGQMVMTMLMIVTSLHMSGHGHGTQAISLVIMAHTLGMFGLSGVTGWLIKRAGRLNMIVAGSIILIAACLLAPVSTSVPVLALSLFLLGLGWNFCFVAGSSLLSSRLIAAERGRAQGAGEVTVALGAALGGFASGLVFTAGGIQAVSIVGLGFSLALLAMVIWVMIDRRPAQAFAPGE